MNLLSFMVQRSSLTIIDACRGEPGDKANTLLHHTKYNGPYHTIIHLLFLISFFYSAGQYSVTVYSLSDPTTCLPPLMITVTPAVMGQNELGAVFQDLEDMLKF